LNRSIDLAQALRRRLTAGPVYGPFCKTVDPAFIETAGHAGFDFCIIDLEHGPASPETAQNLIRAAELTGMVPLVRVKGDRLSQIGEVLDSGAGGVVVPQVGSGDDAARAIAAASFHPLGDRGVCRFVRAAGYSHRDRTDYFTTSNLRLVVLQLEGRPALERAEEIVATPGLDVAFIGPYDLSQSLGFPGDVQHPAVQDAMERIVAVGARHGVAVGTFVDDLDTARRWVAAGVRLIGISVDVGIFYQACATLTAQLRSSS
jgi:4-hydroxy-2-oxoheptanedioate aldolase